MDTKIFKDYKNQDSSLERLPEDLLNDYCQLFSQTFDRSKCYLEYDEFQEEELDDFNGVSRENIFERIVHPVEKYVVLRCRLVVPALGGYTLTLFDVKFKRSMVYPCKMDNFFVNENSIQNTRDETELDRRIEYVFKSGAFQHAMKMILAQIDRKTDGYEAPEFEDEEDEGTA